MKKVFKNVFVAFITTLMFFSCEKNEKLLDQTPKMNNFNVIVEGSSKSKESHKWLHFPSIDDLDNAIMFLEQLDSLEKIETFDEQYEFLSMRTTLTEDYRDSVGLLDDVILALVNPQGEIQIMDYLITLNLLEGYASVADVNNPEDKVYLSTDWSFYDYIQGNVDPSEISKAPIEPTKKPKLRHSLTQKMVFHDYSDYTIECCAAVTNGFFRSSIYAQIKRKTLVLLGAVPTINVNTDFGHYKLKGEETIRGIPRISKSGKKKKYKIDVYSGKKSVIIGESAYDFPSSYYVSLGNNELSYFIYLPAWY